MVIAIIALLAALLLPVLGRGKRSAQSAVCIGNLHQMGIAMTAYVQDNRDRLPVCAGYLPSQRPELPPLSTTLFPLPRINELFHCPAEDSIFLTERTSYEWNFWLNDAPYSAPEWARIYTNEARVIVNTLFGGRDDTPLTGDANPFHDETDELMGKNALFFDGRVERARHTKSTP